MVDLGTLGGAFSIGIDINDSGVVTGLAALADGSYHAFVATMGEPMIDLGTLGAAQSVGQAINGAGQVAGTLYFADGTERAFLATPILKLFNDLYTDTAEVGPDRKLQKQVNMAQTYYDSQDQQMTCSQLAYLNSQIQKLARNKIPQVQADELIGQSTAIMDAIGCP